MNWVEVVGPLAGLGLGFGLHWISERLSSTKLRKYRVIRCPGCSMEIPLSLAAVWVDASPKPSPPRRPQ
mgnify:CR=1 FL=1